MNRPLLLFTFSLSVLIFGQNAQWPTRASRSFSSNFGENRDDHFHMGIDIKTRGTIGHEVYAIEDGYISRMVSNYNGYGKALYLRTKSGREILYGHLDKFKPVLEKVWKLQQTKRKSYIVNANFSPREFQVLKGELIGYSGNSGSSFAPHIHLEVRNKDSEPLNPLAYAFDMPDKVKPEVKNIALVPLSENSIINASPLVQTFPLYRDRSGIYHFPDTISVFGEFGIAIETFDKRQGANNKYQIYKAELVVDGIKKYELKYDKIPFSKTSSANTVIEYGLKRKKLGEFQKLYRMPEHPELDIQTLKESGILRLFPGFHSIEIKVYDVNNNSATIRGMVTSAFPMSIGAEEILRNDMVITLALSPKRGGMPIRDVIIYSFTPYGHTDKNKLKYLHAERVKKDLHVTLDIKDTKNSILQIIAINELGGLSDPYHWTSLKPEYSVIDILPALDISTTERGMFFQIELDKYAPARVKIKLSDNNTFKSFTLNQIQPTVFLSDLLPYKHAEGAKYIDVELSHNGLSRERRFQIHSKVAEPGKETAVVSVDKNCSIQILSNTLYQNNLIWIEKIKTYPEIKNGFQLSSVYQLHPFDLALNNNFNIGIKYDFELAEHSNLGIYYYDNKEGKWVFSKTKNNKRKQILTTSLNQFEAVTIIQDLEPPLILRMHPSEGGRYKNDAITQIRISVDDKLSGIEAEEESFELKLNGQPLYSAYQPVKKEISYYLDRPLKNGNHNINFSVVDRVGNKSEQKIIFSIY